MLLEPQKCSWSASTYSTVGPGRDQIVVERQRCRLQGNTADNSGRVTARIAVYDPKRPLIPEISERLDSHHSPSRLDPAGPGWAAAGQPWAVGGVNPRRARDRWQTPLDLVCLWRGGHPWGAGGRRPGALAQSPQRHADRADFDAGQPAATDAVVFMAEGPCRSVIED